MLQQLGGEEGGGGYLLIIAPPPRPAPLVVRPFWILPKLVFEHESFAFTTTKNAIQNHLSGFHDICYYYLQ